MVWEIKKQSWHHPSEQAKQLGTTNQKSQPSAPRADLSLAASSKSRGRLLLFRNRFSSEGRSLGPWTEAHRHFFFSCCLVFERTVCCCTSRRRMARFCVVESNAKKQELHFSLPLALSTFCFSRQYRNMSLSPVKVHPGALHLHCLIFDGDMGPTQQPVHFRSPAETLNHCLSEKKVCVNSL